jgi:uncharacterized protein YutE (UPF0331/DUF86 family)
VTPGGDLANALDDAERIAEALRRSLARLAPSFPFDAARVAGQDEAARTETDAFLKRFENLVNHLQDQVWRRIVAEEGLRDPATMSRRDILDYMEKLGVIASADDVLDVVRVRNRLSHLYPTDAERQAGQLNRAYAAAERALAALTSARSWAAARGISPPPVSP